MTGFWLIAALMIVVALVIVAPALLRPKLKNLSTGDSQNTEIARERLTQMEAAHKAGDMTDEELQQGRSEVEATLAEELAKESKGFHADNRLGIPALVVIALFLPVLAIAVYQSVGSPDSIVATEKPQQQQTASAGHAGQSGTAASLPDMVDQLAKRMQNEPENADGWFLLGRSQMSLGRYGDAVASFRQVDILSPDTAPVLLALANAVAMNNGGQISGEAESLVLRALKISPDDPVALWLAGNAREEAQDYQAAIDYWQKAIPLLEAHPQDQQELRSRMHRVASAAGIALQQAQAPEAVAATNPATGAGSSGAAMDAGKRLIVKVSLDPALQGQVSPDDSLFVFARALQGPPMPLAASRLQARSLPAVVELDDNSAMMPSMKLSMHDKVKVSAKISKTGNAMPAADDLVSATIEAVPGQDGTIELVISQQRN